jgi:hypothetical protein
MPKCLLVEVNLILRELVALHLELFAGLVHLLILPGQVRRGECALSVTETDVRSVD